MFTGNRTISKELNVNVISFFVKSNLIVFFDDNLGSFSLKTKLLAFSQIHFYFTMAVIKKSKSLLLKRSYDGDFYLQI